jgi:hypothetical protein
VSRYGTFRARAAAAFLVAVAGLLPATPVHADDVRLSVYPPVILATPGKGGSVRLTVTVPRSAENQSLHLGWQYAYPGESGYSYRQLDESSPVQFVRVFDHIPPGVTLFTAEVRTRDGRNQRVEQSLEVK